MAFQAVPDAAEIVIQYSGNSVLSNNVVHAVKPGGYNLTDLTALAVVVDACIVSAWLGQQTQDISYAQTTVRGLAFENDQEVVVNAGAGPGLLVSPALPGNATFAVKRSSNLTGRSARGRLYWIGLALNQLSTNENILTVAASSDIVANVDALRSNIAASVWTPAIVSRFTGGVKRAAGVTFTWTQSVAVNDNVDSQRRRLLG